MTAVTTQDERIPAASRVENQTFQTTELDLPESTAGILLLLGGLAAVATLTIRTSLRDSRFLKQSSRLILLIPRLIVLLLLLMIVLNPQRRTQISRIESSRVGLLIDTSLSMQWPEADASGPPSAAASGSDNGTTPSDTADKGSETTSAAAAPDGPLQTRSEAVLRQLVDSGVLRELSATHSVSIYAFDSALDGPLAVVTDGMVRFIPADERAAGKALTGRSGAAPGTAAVVDLQTDADAAERSLSDPALRDEWRSQLAPRGVETRLGEALYQLVGQVSGRTLSGLVVISDGSLNAGLDIEPARLRAERTGTRLITVGVGGKQALPNLWIAGMQSPADVHKGDPFEVRVSVQGSGIAGQPVVVRLFQQSAEGDGTDRRQIAEQSVTSAADAIPVSVAFSQVLPIAGKYDFIAQVTSAAGVTEMTLDDNERRRLVEVTEKRLKVLTISSGPMRDYQFVRNTLFRHSGVESDVWLQSVTDENIGFVSQESKSLLTKFPATEAELFAYDVVVAFDVDWSRLSRDQQTWLNRWVAEHAGGWYWSRARSLLRSWLRKRMLCVKSVSCIRCC
jgi:hypothetical protein